MHLVTQVTKRTHPARPTAYKARGKVTPDRLLRNSKLLHPTNCVSLYSKHRTEHSLSR